MKSIEFIRKNYITQKEDGVEIVKFENGYRVDVEGLANIINQYVNHLIENMNADKDQPKHDL